MAVCRQRGTRSEAANDGVVGTTPVRWMVATVEPQQCGAGRRGRSGSGTAHIGVGVVEAALPRLQLLSP